MIINENDIKIPEFLLSQERRFNLVICTIFLSPKFSEILYNKQMKKILFCTVYFGEFFRKFERKILNEELIFNTEIMGKLFVGEIKKYFYIQ